MIFKRLIKNCKFEIVTNTTVRYLFFKFIVKISSQDDLTLHTKDVFKTCTGFKNIFTAYCIK